jgi:hypothetical protein
MFKPLLTILFLGANFLFSQSIPITEMDAAHAPKLKTTVQPDYTARAAMAGLKGLAVVSVAIDENGIPQDPKFVAFYSGGGVRGTARVKRDENGQIEHLYDFTSYYTGNKISDPMGLDKAAVAAVRKWRYTPGMKDGKPVQVEAKLEVVFSGPENAPSTTFKEENR